MRRLTLLAFVVVIAAQGAFAASEAESTAADEGPVVIDWVGLRLKTPGGALYPQPDSPIIQEFNEALNIDLRAVKSDAFSAEEMNLLFAAGEIPHHMLASQNNYLRYQDEGLLREIPLDMVKQHAPTYWRDYANGLVEGIWFDFPSWNKDTESLWALPNGGLEIKGSRQNKDHKQAKRSRPSSRPLIRCSTRPAAALGCGRGAAAGRGGIACVAAATGISRTTIRAGLKELDAKQAPDAGADAGRLRRPGAGRQPLRPAIRGWRTRWSGW